MLGYFKACYLSYRAQNWKLVNLYCWQTCSGIPTRAAVSHWLTEGLGRRPLPIKFYGILTISVHDMQLWSHTCVYDIKRAIILCPDIHNVRWEAIISGKLLHESRCHRRNHHKCCISKFFIKSTFFGTKFMLKMRY